MMKYLKTNMCYIKPDKKFILVLALNTLFVLLTIGTIKLIEWCANDLIEALKNVDLSNVLTQSELQLNATTTIMERFIVFILIAVISFILFMAANWSFFQSVIWSILLQKKFTLKFFGKFLLLNMVWFLPWLALIFIIWFGAKPNLLIILLALLILSFFHFSFILYALFAKESKFREIKEAIKSGVCKLHYFILPYIFVLIIFMIISILSNLLAIRFLNGLIIAGLNLVLFLIFFSWLECCVGNIVISWKIKK